MLRLGFGNIYAVGNWTVANSEGNTPSLISSWTSLAWNESLSSNWMADSMPHWTMTRAEQLYSKKQDLLS